MSNIFDAISDEARVVIVEELAQRNPALLHPLQEAERPTNEQSDKVVDNAFAAYLSAWLIRR